MKSILNWELQDDIRRAYKLAIENYNLYSTCFERIQYLDKFLDKCNWFDISFNERNGIKRVTLWIHQDNKQKCWDELQLATVSTDANEGMICDLFEHLIYKNLGKLKKKERN